MDAAVDPRLLEAFATLTDTDLTTLAAAAPQWPELAATLTAGVADRSALGAVACLTWSRLVLFARIEMEDERLFNKLCCVADLCHDLWYDDFQEQIRQAGGRELGMFSVEGNVLVSEMIDRAIAQARDAQLTDRQIATLLGREMRQLDDADHDEVYDTEVLERIIGELCGAGVIGSRGASAIRSRARLEV